MPRIEKKDEYYHVRVRNPSDFQKMRTITFSKSKGIKAVVGKESKTASMKLQSILFKISKWNKTSIKKWMKKHKDSIRKLDEKLRG